jgi:hypothetical protein
MGWLGSSSQDSLLAAGPDTPRDVAGEARLTALTRENERAVEVAWRHLREAKEALRAAEEALEHARRLEAVAHCLLDEQV